MSANDGKISGLTRISGLDRANDLFEVDDVSLAASKSATVNDMLGLTSAPLGTTETQSPTNKTFDNTNTITVKDTLFTLQDDSDPTRQAKFQLSSITTGTTRTYTMPNASGTLADIASAQTFTNKTLTSPVINTPTINNPTLNTDAISEFTASNGVTVSGMNVKSGKLNTNNSVVTANITDAAVTPNKLVASSGTGWAWQTFVPSWTNLTVGNGTLTARYSQIGKKVKIFIAFVLGNTSAVGGDISFTPPVTASSLYTTVALNVVIGNGQMTAGSTTAPTLPFFNASNASIHIGYGASSSGALTATGGSAPGVWTTANSFYTNLEYEAA